MGPRRKEKQKVITALVNDPILRKIPDPVARLDITDIKGIHESYKKCIEDIHKAMIEDSDNVFTFEDKGGFKYVPVTTGPDNSPDGAYVIDLTDGKNKLQLVASKCQTWFRGIVINDDKRFEIDMDQSTPKMMAGSKSLHTTAVYCKLLGETVAHCRIGIKSLKESFKALVELDKKGYKTAIAVLLVMFFEAPRFVPVYKACLRSLKESKGDEYVGEDAKDLINGWSVICRDFFNANGDKMTVTLNDKTSDPVKKVADNVRILSWSSDWDSWCKKNSKDISKQRKWDRRSNARGNG